MLHDNLVQLESVEERAHLNMCTYGAAARQMVLRHFRGDN
jgi:hypothetical protein